MSFRWLLLWTVGLFTLCCIATTALAVAPSPEAIEKWKAEGVLEEKLAQLRAFKAAGGCSPVSYPDEVKARYQARFAADANAVETLHIVVILVDFSDWPYTGQAKAGTKQQFDSILFSDRRVDVVYNDAGSMTDFYLENSYGKMFIHGEVFGWYRMPQTYAWYVGADDGFSTGPLLANHAVSAANIDVDYSTFNNPGMGVPIVVVHAGPGAETGAYGIWSHKSNISGVPVWDGIPLTTYNIVPEEFGSELSPIGVFCHEFGHTLNLPDLYDTSPQTGSEGLGGWSLMASGNYNGGSRYPSHFDPWCKRNVDPFPFIDNFINVTANLDSVAIPTVQFNPVVYMIRDSSAATSEYWLIENRQARGFDLGLPGVGLCIYHVDDAVGIGYNDNPSRYRVALEQADNLNSLAFGGSRGDAGDTWPGTSNNRNFHTLSAPNSRTNVGTKITEVAVWNISDPDSIMYADLDFRYSRPYLVLTGPDSTEFVEVPGLSDGDGIFEEGETIDFHCRIDNLMRPAWDWYVTLASDNPYIEFLTNNVMQDNYLSPIIEDDFRAANPVRFILKPGASSDITSFTLTVQADSSVGSGDKRYQETFNFYAAMGPVNVLIVDDDNGDTSGEIYAQSFSRLRIPYVLWDKATQGSPTITDLNKYKHLFWATGLKSSGGQLTAADRNVIKAFLDAGGNFALGSAGAAIQLRQSDSVFMRDYLHARYEDSLTTGVFYYGVIGVPLTEGVRYRAETTAPAEVKRPYKLQPANGGQVCWEVSPSIFGTPKTGNVGIMYSGGYKTVFTSFGFEYVSLSDTLNNYAHRDTLFMRIMQFFGGTATSIEDPDRPRLPEQFSLAQNYPNPFNPSTTIKYTVNYAGPGKSSRGRTFLAVYNLMGQQVRTLVDTEQGVGEYTVHWDGTDQSGQKVASGVYLYRLERGERTESRKMVLLK